MKKYVLTLGALASVVAPVAAVVACGTSGTSKPITPKEEVSSIKKQLAKLKGEVKVEDVFDHKVADDPFTKNHLKLAIKKVIKVNEDLTVLTFTNLVPNIDDGKVTVNVGFNVSNESYAPQKIITFNGFLTKSANDQKVLDQAKHEIRNLTARTKLSNSETIIPSTVVTNATPRSLGFIEPIITGASFQYKATANDALGTIDVETTITVGKLSAKVSFKLDGFLVTSKLGKLKAAAKKELDTIIIPVLNNDLHDASLFTVITSTKVKARGDIDKANDATSVDVAKANGITAINEAIKAYNNSKSATVIVQALPSTAFDSLSDSTKLNSTVSLIDVHNVLIKLPEVTKLSQFQIGTLHINDMTLDTSIDGSLKIVIKNHGNDKLFTVTGFAKLSEKIAKDKAKFDKFKQSVTAKTPPLATGPITIDVLNALPGINSMPLMTIGVMRTFAVKVVNSNAGEATIEVRFTSGSLKDTTTYTISGFQTSSGIANAKIAKDKAKFSSFSQRVAPNTPLLTTGPITSTKLNNLPGVNHTTPQSTVGVTRIFKVASLNSNAGEATIEVTFTSGLTSDTTTYTISGFQSLSPITTHHSTFAVTTDGKPPTTDFSGLKPINVLEKHTLADWNSIIDVISVSKNFGPTRVGPYAVKSNWYAGVITKDSKATKSGSFVFVRPDEAIDAFFAKHHDDLDATKNIIKMAPEITRTLDAYKVYTDETSPSNYVLPPKGKIRESKYKGSFQPYYDYGFSWYQFFEPNKNWILNDIGSNSLVHLGFIAAVDSGVSGDNWGWKHRIQQANSDGSSFGTTLEKKVNIAKQHHIVIPTLAGFIPLWFNNYTAAWNAEAPSKDSTKSGPTINFLNKIREQNSDYIFSFGGWNNDTIALQATFEKYSAAQLAAIYKNVIMKLDLNFIDFDIEGTDDGNSDDFHIGDPKFNSIYTKEIARKSQLLRMEALKLVKKWKPSLKISYTIPASLIGVRDNPNKDILFNGLKNGVISRINLMAMDYNTKFLNMSRITVPGEMAAYVISSVNSMKDDLISNGIVTNEHDAYDLIGAVPLIGVGDGQQRNQIFSPLDMRVLKDFAIKHNLSALSEWSLLRDHWSEIGNQFKTSNGKVSHKPPVSLEEVIRWSKNKTPFIGDSFTIGVSGLWQNGIFEKIGKKYNSKTLEPDNYYDNKISPKLLRALNISNINELINGSSFTTTTALNINISDQEMISLYKGNISSNTPTPNINIPSNSITSASHHITLPNNYSNAQNHSSIGRVKSNGNPIQKWNPNLVDYSSRKIVSGVMTQPYVAGQVVNWYGKKYTAMQAVIVGNPADWYPQDGKIYAQTGIWKESTQKDIDTYLHGPTATKNPISLTKERFHYSDNPTASEIDSKTIVAPFIDVDVAKQTWNWDTIVAQNNSVTFAFITGINSPQLGRWGKSNKPLDSKVELARKFWDKGKDIIVSIGGAAGNVPATYASNGIELANFYKKLIDSYHLKVLDFDIENSEQKAANVWRKRVEAFKILQTDSNPKYRDIKLSFTLATVPPINNWNQGSISFLSKILDSGVKIGIINAMTMDDGTGFWNSNSPDPTIFHSSSDQAIMVAIKIASKLKEHYTKINQPISNEKIWSMIGITPMIGINDTKVEITYPHDLRKIAAFANNPNHRLGMISFWSATRDYEYNHINGLAKATFSGIETNPFEFTRSYINYRTMPEYENKYFRMHSEQTYNEIPMDILDAKAANFDVTFANKKVHYEDIK